MSTIGYVEARSIGLPRYTEIRALLLRARTRTPHPRVTLPCAALSDLRLTVASSASRYRGTISVLSDRRTSAAGKRIFFGFIDKNASFVPSDDLKADTNTWTTVVEALSPFADGQGGIDHLKPEAGADDDAYRRHQSCPLAGHYPAPDHLAARLLQSR